MGPLSLPRFFLDLVYTSEPLLLRRKLATVSTAKSFEFHNDSKSVAIQVRREKIHTERKSTTKDTFRCSRYENKHAYVRIGPANYAWSALCGNELHTERPRGNESFLRSLLQILQIDA